MLNFEETLQDIKIYSCQPFVSILFPTEKAVNQQTSHNYKYTHVRFTNTHYNSLGNIAYL